MPVLPDIAALRDRYLAHLSGRQRSRLAANAANMLIGHPAAWRGDQDERA